MVAPSSLVIFVTLIGLTSGLQISTRAAGHGAYRPVSLNRLSVSPGMQFGNSDGPKGLSRDSEPEEFFKTNMDSMSDEEKLKSPVVIGGILLLVAPFLIGMVALSLAK
mmetsp:Transcript_16959/g.28271  ORF Transcript_16959/g.28271 Transcript_16959/m.28271 type:complete len:108 (-) Transcript_16959:482-805(-)|eukprot:CAMPEP_0119308896 /NCGR_PEP_ID=MMETSP1333-20130426/12832_1 /TAXON_ID=418940 /ORGANISM="Scyphosphaera apsteinii, Strain RCC1455" /LENGTH=107 /DNA_ID=CAMNT_0007312771 /DNA_START=30 /DNA_END=353 /DNA_ORIENTATION=-